MMVTVPEIGGHHKFGQPQGINPAVLLVIAAVFLGGCARSDRGFDRAKLTGDVNKNAIVRLADYSAFEWDRVHVFPPYTTPATIEQEVGTRMTFPHADSEGCCLLVFLSRGKIAASFEIQRMRLDFADLFQHGGYAREEAVFAVGTRGTDLRRYLKKKRP